MWPACAHEFFSIITFGTVKLNTLVWTATLSFVKSIQPHRRERFTQTSPCHYQVVMAVVNAWWRERPQTFLTAVTDLKTSFKTILHSQLQRHRSSITAPDIFQICHLRKQLHTRCLAKAERSVTPPPRSVQHNKKPNTCALNEEDINRNNAFINHDASRLNWMHELTQWHMNYQLQQNWYIQL